MSQNSGKQGLEPISYRTDLINAEMGRQRLTNETVAEKARVGVKSVSAIRNGDPNVKLPTLQAVVGALGLTLRDVFEPIAEPEAA